MQQEPQSAGQSQQQNIMAQPPQVLTVKDSLYIADMLSWNLLAMKKAYFYAGQCQDNQVKEAINQCGRMHEQHYNRILSHLSDSQAGQTIQ